MASAYGHSLNPYRSLKEPCGVKGIRQTVVITNNPSTIDQNQTLLVRFPNLGQNDVIVPGSVKLAFEISLTSTDANRTIVNNLGRAVVKKKTIKIEGNEVLSVDDCDVYDCYQDMWQPPSVSRNAAYQGVSLDDSGSINENMLALRIAAGDKVVTTKKDKAVSDAFGKRFCIPLDFELLDSHMPFYQSALADRLSYELSFNDYSRVIKASGDTAATYTISGISLEYEVVTNSELARLIRQQLQGKVAILYERVLRHRKVTVNKSDTVWNINLNTPARSLKGILMIFEDPAAGGEAWDRNTLEFYNPLIEKVEVTIEGVPNQLFAHGMRPYQQWHEALKRYGGCPALHLPAEIAQVAKHLGLVGVSLPDYLTNQYCCWLDMRTTDDDGLHGSGRRIENGSEGITLQITKKAESAGTLNMYIYVVMDAQLNLEDGRFKSALY
jgi:hypothetical protein